MALLIRRNLLTDENVLLTSFQVVVKGVSIYAAMKRKNFTRGMSKKVGGSFKKLASSFQRREK
jgi:hypothetical protein